MIRMDTIITKEAVATAVYEAIPHLACELPADILAGLAAALEREEAPRGRGLVVLRLQRAVVDVDPHERALVARVARVRLERQLPRQRRVAVLDR